MNSNNERRLQNVRKELFRLSTELQGLKFQIDAYNNLIPELITDLSKARTLEQIQSINRHLTDFTQKKKEAEKTYAELIPRFRELEKEERMIEIRKITKIKEKYYQQSSEKYDKIREYINNISSRNKNSSLIKNNQIIYQFPSANEVVEDVGDVEEKITTVTSSEGGKKRSTKKRSTKKKTSTKKRSTKK